MAKGKTKYVYTKQVEKKTKGHSISVVDVAREDGKDVNEKMMNNLYKELAKKYDPRDIIVRGLGPDRWATLKGLGDDELNLKDYEEYYEDRVKDTGKFMTFSQIQVIVKKDT